MLTLLFVSVAITALVGIVAWYGADPANSK